MKPSKNLLFPFTTDSAYFEGYAWAVSLAIRMDATLRLLAAVPPSVDISEHQNTIYCSLLEAHGYYLEHYHQGPLKKPPIRRQPLSATGDLGQDLLECLTDEPADIVIIDESFRKKNGRVLKKLIKGPAGLIILPVKSHERKSDPFYHQLLGAEFHNLPPQFYTDLGRDTSGHNYLRKLFPFRDQ